MNIYFSTIESGFHGIWCPWLFLQNRRRKKVTDVENCFCFFQVTILSKSKDVTAFIHHLLGESWYFESKYMKVFFQVWKDSRHLNSIDSCSILDYNSFSWVNKQSREPHQQNCHAPTYIIQREKSCKIQLKWASSALKQRWICWIQGYKTKGYKGKKWPQNNKPVIRSKRQNCCP